MTKKKQTPKVEGCFRGLFRFVAEKAYFSFMPLFQALPTLSAMVK